MSFPEAAVSTRGLIWYARNLESPSRCPLASNAGSSQLARRRAKTRNEQLQQEWVPVIFQYTSETSSALAFLVRLKDLTAPLPAVWHGHNYPVAVKCSSSVSRRGLLVSASSASLLRHASVVSRDVPIQGCFDTCVSFPASGSGVCHQSTIRYYQTLRHQRSVDRLSETQHIAFMHHDVMRNAIFLPMHPLRPHPLRPTRPPHGRRRFLRI